MNIRSVTLSLFAFLLAVQPAFAAFSDVTTDNTYAPAIQFLEQNGVGTNRDNFFPNRPITFVEFLGMGFAALGVQSTDLTEHQTRFTDVPTDAWYAPYIARADKIGMLGNYRTTLSPNHPVTRAEAAQLALSLFGFSAPASILNEEFGFTDVPATHRLAPQIFTAVKLGAIDPKSNEEYGAGEQMTRGEAAETLYRLATGKAGNAATAVIQIGSSSIPNENLLETVWNEVKKKFLYGDRIDEEKMLYAAIEGAVNALGDQYTTFLPPADSSAFSDNLSGNLEGIGAYLSKDDKTDEIVIVAPIKDSPADKAGLKPSDIIISVDDISTAKLSLQEVTAKIKGTAGTSVKLGIKRGGDTLTFTVTRAKIDVKTVTVEYKNNIAVITITQFGGTTADEFAAVAADIAKNQPSGIIIDLRNNPGGLLDTAVDLLGYFLPKDSVAATAKFRDGTRPDVVYKTERDPTLAGFKTVVLVNKGSASASEIMAGALQDDKVATLVGETTFGKGTMQELTFFTNGTALKVTVAHWFSPNNQPIDHHGVVPDIQSIDDDATKTTDEALDRAMQLFR